MPNVSNEELVRKAVVTTDALAASGKLNPAQSERFIDYVIQETVLKDNARVVRFRNETLEIDKIGIGRRVAMPKSEAADPALRRGVHTSKIALTPREIIVPFEISDNFKEINIEGDASEDHIIQMMARQLANDLEDLYANGDVLGAAAIEGDLKEGGSTTKYIRDSFLGLFDGWGRLADGGNLVDLGAINVGLNVFSRMLRQMPTKFRRNKAAMRWYMSPDLAQNYVEKLASRATAVGDAAVNGTSASPFGVKIVEVPLMPFLPRVVEHIAFTGAGSTIQLRYKPVRNVVVTVSTLNQTPVDAYALTTDYTVNESLGQVTHVGGGGIGNTETVKITYEANPQVLLTHAMNFIVGIGRDIRIEKDRDIYKGVNQYAITAKVAVEFEEDTAIVKGYNIGDSV